MSIDSKDVENIAHLARLHLAEDDLPEVTSSIENILSLIDEMQSVDTGNVSPLAHAFEVSQRLRDDVVTETDQRERLQSIAPSVEAGLYRVPRVIE